MPNSLDLPAATGSPTSLLPDLVCTCTVRGRDSVGVHVTGTLDRGAASLLEQTLRRSDLRRGMIVLDLRGLTVIDLAGVRVIMDASIEAWLGDRRLLLVRGPSHVDRVFAVADVADVVEIGDLHPPEPPVRRSCGSRASSRLEDAAAPISEPTASARTKYRPSLFSPSGRTRTGLLGSGRSHSGCRPSARVVDPRQSHARWMTRGGVRAPAGAGRA